MDVLIRNVDHSLVDISADMLNSLFPRSGNEFREYLRISTMWKGIGKIDEEGVVSAW